MQKNEGQKNGRSYSRAVRDAWSSIVLPASFCRVQLTAKNPIRVIRLVRGSNSFWLPPKAGLGNPWSFSAVWSARPGPGSEMNLLDDAPGRSQHVALVVPRLQHRLHGAADRFP